MLTIDFLPGTHIDKAAQLLVDSAPARATFNDIPIRARYATTKPRDIVAGFERKSAERAEAWKRSPAGKRYAAEQEAERTKAQAAVDAGMADLGALKLAESEGSYREPPGLSVGEIADVLAWVRRMASPCDRIGVKVDWPMIREVFRATGWEPNANCGEAFNADDARNFAGWIVGQWLTGYPNVGMFIDQWTEKFGARA